MGKTMKIFLMKLFKNGLVIIIRIILKILTILSNEFNARKWSNSELRRWGKIFRGNIINVSGWDDRDKEGGHYCDYFPNKSSYIISNIAGSHGRTGNKDDIFIDLQKELAQDLVKHFDVVFNHTTLEHIFDVKCAVNNLCKLSNLHYS